MIVEELYIDGKKADIKDVSIVRNYKTPFFSDFDKIMSDSTYSIKLPETENNKAIMEYLNEPDMATDFPYKYHSVEYIVDGIAVITNGKAYVSGDFEIQVVYGVNKELFAGFKSKKLNELYYNPSEWIAKWGGNFTYPSDAKYSFPNYVSVIKKSDAYVIDGIIQPPPAIPEPYDTNKKTMTLHPWVSFRNIVNLISYDFILDNSIFDKIKNRLTNLGLLICKNTDNYTDIYTKNYNNNVYSGKWLQIGSGSHGGISLFDVNTELFLKKDNTEYQYINFGKINIVLNFKISSNTGGLRLVSYKYENNVLVPEIIQQIPYDIDGTKHVYNTTIVLGDGMNELSYGIEFNNGNVTNVTHYGTGYIRIEAKQQNAVYAMANNVGIEGRFNIIAGLGDMKVSDFFNNLCKLTGCVINGNLNILTYDAFVSNLKNGIYSDWSGRISNVKKSDYKFNSNAKKNWFRYNNSDKLSYETRYPFIVNDATLDEEKDLFKVDFDLGDNLLLGRTEKILYEQTVKIDGNKTSFACEYKEADNIVCANYGDLYNTDLLPVTTHGVMQMNPIIYPYFKRYRYYVSESPDYSTYILYDMYGDLFSNIAVGDYIVGSGNIDFAQPYNTITSKQIYTVDDLQVCEIVVSGDPYEQHITSNQQILIMKSIQLGETTKKFTIENYADLEGFTPKVGDDVLLIDGSAVTDGIKSVDYTNELNPIFELNTNSFHNDSEHTMRISINIDGIVSRYYSEFEKLINRPIVKEVSVLLDVFETTNIDFEKPIYISEWGKYCMLLELTAPNKGLCTAKLLLINQTL